MEKCGKGSYILDLPIQQFSILCNHDPGIEGMAYEMRFHADPDSIRSSELNLTVHIYLNGQSPDDRGYLSVMFGGKYKKGGLGRVDKPRKLEFDCVVTVKDIHGKLRFSQSIVYSKRIRKYLYNKIDRNAIPSFGLEKYIKQNVLLDDSKEFLSNDVLTLHFYMSVNHIWPDICIKEFFETWKASVGNITTEKNENGDNVLVIPFDCPEFQLICNASPYFDRIQNSDFLEASNKFVTIPTYEMMAFVDLYTYILSKRISHIRSMVGTTKVFRLLDLYEVADKYEVLDLFEMCATELKRCITHENAKNIVQIAVKHSDNSLRDLAAMYVLDADDSLFKPKCETRDEFNKRYNRNNLLMLSFYDYVNINMPVLTQKSEKKREAYEFYF